MARRAWVKNGLKPKEELKRRQIVMDVRVVEASLDQKPALHRLMQLYLHDSTGVGAKHKQSSANMPPLTPRLM